MGIQPLSLEHQFVLAQSALNEFESTPMLNGLVGAKFADHLARVVFKRNSERPSRRDTTKRVGLWTEITPRPFLAARKKTPTLSIAKTESRARFAYRTALSFSPTRGFQYRMASLITLVS
jgi:hypothetical protein